jgi:hypothetical protein
MERGKFVWDMSQLSRDRFQSLCGLVSGRRPGGWFRLQMGPKNPFRMLSLAPERTPSATIPASRPCWRGKGMMWSTEAPCLCPYL